MAFEHLLKSSDVKAQTLGLAALGKVLEATHFSSSRLFDFGARSRDYGYQPQSDTDVTQWYGAALVFIERLVLTESTLKRRLIALLVQNFRALWTSAQVHDELEILFRTSPPVASGTRVGPHVARQCISTAKTCHQTSYRGYLPLRPT